MLDSIIHYFESISPILAAFYASLFTWFTTALGASLVFFFKKMNQNIFDGMLGFTGGVMMAASYFSLLAPAIDMSTHEGQVNMLPIVLGFLFGALFIYGLDKILPHLNKKYKTASDEKSPWRKTSLLTLAITLHNIPEGLAIGVLFGGVAAGIPEASIAAAVTLAIGIAIQDFPEGIAVSIPLRRMGMSRRKSFFYGQASAIVEPIFGVLGALAVLFFTAILPFALAFSAAAMIYVVLVEIIPETQNRNSKNIGIGGFIVGFVVMMTLDVIFS